MDNVRKIIFLASEYDKRRFINIIAISLISAVFELASILSIAPFLLLVQSPTTYMDLKITHLISEIFGIDAWHSLVMVVGAMSLVLILTGSFLSLYALRYINHFVADLGCSISTSVFKRFLSIHDKYTLKYPAEDLINTVQYEVDRFTYLAALPFVTLISKTVTMLVIGLGVSLLNITAAAISVSVLVVFYLGVYKRLRPLLTGNGVVISDSQNERLKWLHGGISGFREVFLNQLETTFLNNFSANSSRLFRAKADNLIYAGAPRFLVEGAVFSAIIIFIVVAVYAGRQSTSDLIVLLAVVGAAGLKLLPAAQQFYTSVTQMKANAGPVSRVHEVFLAGLQESSNGGNVDCKLPTSRSFAPQEALPVLRVNDVWFKYEDSPTWLFKEMNLELFPGDTLGVIGESGVGKSTLLDLVTGIEHPSRGNVVGEGGLNCIYSEHKIGYVQQEVFIFSGTVAENVAMQFGSDKVDFDRVWGCLRVVGLDKHISSLDRRENTLLMEGGGALSGGQRQRLGIARCLYRDSSLMVFDEPTSALDEATEAQIVECIAALPGNIIKIIVSHRRAPLNICNRIVTLKPNRAGFIELLEEDLL